MYNNSERKQVNIISDFHRAHGVGENVRARGAIFGPASVQRRPADRPAGFALQFFLVKNEFYL